MPRKIARMPDQYHKQNFSRLEAAFPLAVSILSAHCGLIVGNGSFSVGISTSDGGLGDASQGDAGDAGDASDASDTGTGGDATGADAADAGFCATVSPFPLDVVEDASAAYGLRPLSSTYRGPLVVLAVGSSTLMISTDGGPFPLTEVLTWADGGNVGIETWYDQSGNGNNVLQYTTTSQPKLTYNAINNLPGATFTGSNQTVLAGNFNWVAGNAPWSTLSTVLSASLIDAGAYQPIIAYGTSITSLKSFNVDTQLGSGPYYGVTAYGADLVGSYRTSGPVTFTATYGPPTPDAGGIVSGSVNLTPLTFTGANASDYGPLAITGTSFFIGGTTLQGVYMTGTLGTVILYPTDLSSDQTTILQQIEQCFYGFGVGQP